MFYLLPQVSQKFAKAANTTVKLMTAVKHSRDHGPHLQSILLDLKKPLRL